MIDLYKKDILILEMSVEKVKMICLDVSIGEIKMVSITKLLSKDKGNVDHVMQLPLFHHLKLESELKVIININHIYLLVVVWDAVDIIKDVTEDILI
jgi:hypothetical protein